MYTQANLVKALYKCIPHNQYNLPEGFFRLDILPCIDQLFDNDNKLAAAINNNISKNNSNNNQEIILPNINPVIKYDLQEYIPSKYSQLQSLLGLSANTIIKYENEFDAAYTLIDYTEGYPTYNALPIWDQLPFEPLDAYYNFQDYLLQTEKQRNQPIRQLSSLITKDQEVPLTTLQDQFSLYYWSFRARAYDLFNIICRKKARERRAAEVEDTHYIFATRMLSMCEAYLARNAQELQETMSPKHFIEMVKMATELQRSALQIQDKSALKTPEGATTEVILKTVNHNATNTNTNTSTGTNANSRTSGDINTISANQLNAVLKDESALSLAQELIVKFNNSSN